MLSIQVDRQMARIGSERSSISNRVRKPDEGASVERISSTCTHSLYASLVSVRLSLLCRFQHSRNCVNYALWPQHFNDISQPPLALHLWMRRLGADTHTSSVHCLQSFFSEWHSVSFQFSSDIRSAVGSPRKAQGATYLHSRC